MPKNTERHPDFVMIGGAGTYAEGDKRNERWVNAYRTLPVEDVPAGAYYSSEQIAAAMSDLIGGAIHWFVNGKWIVAGEPGDRRLVEVMVDESRLGIPVAP